MGRVYLIGAGPGDPELLTVRAARLLSSANVVLFDSLVSDEIRTLISPSAQQIDVGKRAGQKLLSQDEINSLLVAYAQKHETVVRLKGGDPTIFGRAGEEIAALRHAGIPFEIVPGITAAFGAAAAAGISLTDRRVASQVLFTTFSRGSDASQMDWGCVTATTTLVLYMPGTNYAELGLRLLDGGLPVDHPCAIISNATRPNQEVRYTNISSLLHDPTLPAPALLIVGRVAAQDVAELGNQFWTAAQTEKQQRQISQATLI